MSFLWLIRYICLINFLIIFEILSKKIKSMLFNIVIYFSSIIPIKSLATTLFSC
ncbi:hypothetical protein AO368_1108 [Moraxella catarrhalis]|nr:hypothetical protein AO368_1108 [Moraxella catarrhalis]